MRWLEEVVETERTAAASKGVPDNAANGKAALPEPSEKPERQRCVGGKSGLSTGLGHDTPSEQATAKLAKSQPAPFLKRVRSVMQVLQFRPDTRAPSVA